VWRWGSRSAPLAPVPTSRAARAVAVVAHTRLHPLPTHSPHLPHPTLRHAPQEALIRAIAESEEARVASLTVKDAEIARLATERDASAGRAAAAAAEVDRLRGELASAQAESAKLEEAASRALEAGLANGLVSVVEAQSAAREAQAVVASERASARADAAARIASAEAMASSRIAALEAYVNNVDPINSIRRGAIHSTKEFFRSKIAGQFRQIYYKVLRIEIVSDIPIKRVMRNQNICKRGSRIRDVSFSLKFQKEIPY
jgi:hypothetical protein